MEDAFVVELAKVSKDYVGGGETTRVLTDISFQASPAELTLLLGPSGSGKTTFLSLVAGFTQPTAGDIRLFGNDIHRYSATKLAALRALRLGFVFQSFLLIDSLTVEENIELVRTFARFARKREGRGRSGEEIARGSEHRPQVTELLDRFGIAGLRRRYPPQLSQGERQRVAIARAIANDAQLILADEPTASLHADQGLEVIELLKHLATEDNRSVIVASHDTRLAEYATRTVTLTSGRFKSVRE